MTKTSLTKLNSFKWTPVRLKAAKLAADTTMTQEEIAEQCKVSRVTINTWFQVPEFKEKVAELIMQDDLFTRAGLLKTIKPVYLDKMAKAGNDRSTSADWTKIIADIIGLNKQATNEVNVYNAVGVVNTQEVKDAVSRLCEKLREADDSTE